MAAYSGYGKKAPHGYKQIQADLKNGSLKNVLMFYGIEKYLIRWACDQVYKRFVFPATELFDFTRIDCSAAGTEEIIDACETLPMMSEKKVVFAEEFDESSGKGEELAEYLKNFPKTAILVIICKSADKRKKLYKAVNKYGAAYEFERLDMPLLKSFLTKRFRNAKKDFDPDLLHYFIDLSGYFDRDSDYTLDNLVNDVEKTVAHSGSRITADDIENAVAGNAERNVFAFTDALAAGRKGEALKILHSLFEYGENVFKLLGLICSHYETMLAVCEMRGDGMNLAQMKKTLGIHEFRIKKAMGAVSKYDPGHLRKILMRAYEADRNIKTGLTEPEIALELFVAGV